MYILGCVLAYGRLNAHVSYFDLEFGKNIYYFVLIMSLSSWVVFFVGLVFYWVSFENRFIKF